MEQREPDSGGCLGVVIIVILSTLFWTALVYLLISLKG